MNKISAISVVNNESDIIESFCLYTLTFCDELLVCDDHSSDDTTIILEKLMADGLPLVVMKNTDNTQNGHYQALMINTLAQMAVDRGADLILPLDVSKFLTSLTGQSVREILGKMNGGTEHLLVSQIFVPGGVASDNTMFLPSCFTQCCPQQYNTLGGVIVGAKLLRDGWQIAQGNQFLYSKDSNNMIAPIVCGELLLAHYPVRSVAQLQTRVIIDRLKFLNMPERDIQPTHYINCNQQLYDYIKNNEIEHADLPILALAYALALFNTMNGEGGALPAIDLEDDGLSEELSACCLAEDIKLKYTDYSKAQHNLYNLVFSQMELFALAFRERHRPPVGEE